MKQTQMHLKSILISLCIFLHFAANESSQHPLQTKHFVLVHGSCHGAWSWFKLVALLKSSGDNVTALDLAASGIDPRRMNNLKSISDFFKPLMDFMEALPLPLPLPAHGKVILVGHSLGGLVFSYAMERFPNKISVAVFVTALMPGPDLNISTLSSKALSSLGTPMDCKYTYDDGPNNPPTTFIFGALYLKSKVYQLSPTEDWALATMLMKPLRLFSEDDMSKKLRLSKEKYGSIKRVFVISGKDLVIKKDLAWWMIKRNPPHQVEEIEESDHIVMMSKPEELRAHLLDIANKYTSHDP